MHLALPLAAALFFLAAPAAAGPAAAPATFAALREQATEVPRPASAIAVLVGDCNKGDAIDQQECQKNIGEAQKKLGDKRVVLNLGAGHEKLLEMGGMRDGKARVLWAPLYDAGNGLALTVGKPQKLSATGNVVVAKRPFDGLLPDDVMDSDLARAAQLGQVVVEVVGRFGKTWTLRTGDKTVQGVSFELEGLRLTHSRTGKVLLELVL